MHFWSSNATEFPLAWGIPGSQPSLGNFQKDISKYFTIFYLIFSLIFILSEIIILSLKEYEVKNTYLLPTGWGVPNYIICQTQPSSNICGISHSTADLPYLFE